MDSSEKITRSIAKGSYIGQLASDLLLQDQPASEKGYANTRDLPQNHKWIKQSFMVPFETTGNSLAAMDRLNGRVTSATLKYTDSSPGGNIPINPPPQFTPYADIRDPGLHAKEHSWFKTSVGTVPNNVVLEMKPRTSYGMGRYYSEAVDDNAQVIHMRFGVATYNSLLQFFTGFYSSGMATVARTARFTSDFWAKAMTFAGQMIGIAIAPLFLIPMALLLVGSAARYFLNMPSTKFYYLKPAMPVYWTAVSSIVNQMSSLLGLTNDLATKQAQDVLAKGDGVTPGATGNIVTLVSKFVQDEWMDSSGMIDVRNIASRSKRLQAQFEIALNEMFNKMSGTSTSYENVLIAAYTNTREGGIKRTTGKIAPEDYLKKWKDSWFGDGSSTQDGGFEADYRAQATKNDSSSTSSGTQGTGSAANSGNGTLADYASDAKKYANKVADFFIAEVADGSDWVSFKVDYTGPTSESFDNSTAPSSLASKINSLSASNREIRMNLAEGNIVPGAGAVIESIKEVVGGVASVLHLDGLAAAAGSAFVDMPDNWDNSHARLPTSSYTIQLISPYGNPISQMISIYMPLACLLAGALPLATGAQSYTSPFLCQLHDRGRNFIRLGIIDSISISRGTSNLGFTKDGRCLAIDVTFSVKDLSSIVSVPITAQGFEILNPLQGLFDDQNSFSDYLFAMCGVSLSDCIYKVGPMKYRLQQKYNDIKTYFSASSIASSLTSVPGVGLMNAIFRGTNR